MSPKPKYTKAENIWSKLLMIASTAPGVAGLIFLCLATLGYEKTWTLPAALGCNALALLYQNIFRLRNK